MLAKKFALAFGLAVVFPAMIHCGVSIFSPQPRWQDYTVAPMINRTRLNGSKRKLNEEPPKRCLKNTSSLWQFLLV